ncbi:MAG: 16S rRNA (guanine(966)-N(2))-methyltransferase RsmD [Clostridia bacterium]|nr:16S rRNA (guanine(966)-N(2))-methyltransferase RsmD [Clostridia bacterium]
MMRIITGKARGVKLLAPKGENTRPTAERTKEAVYSMLQFEISGKEVLDLIAGSGQMGLEALSRGAKHAVLCDRSREAVDVIHTNAQKTRLASDCDIFCMDYEALLTNLRRKKQFDLIFLDPPYALGAIPKALQKLVSYGLLREDAKIICETANSEDVFGTDETLEANFEILRTSHYGVAYVTVLQYNSDNGKDIML